MKNILTLICLLFVEANLAQITYKTSFLPDSNAVVSLLLPTSEEGTTILGYVPFECPRDVLCKKYLYARHFNNEGILSWSKKYGLEMSFSRTKAASTKDEASLLPAACTIWKRK
jgi:hypothetical protein